MVIAAFDVDGTLTTRDCVRPFLERAAGRRRLVTSMLRRPFATVAAAVRRDRDRFKEIIVGGSLRGKLIADVERSGEQFAQYVLVNWLRPDTLRRLRWHQQQRAPDRDRVGVAGGLPAAAGAAPRHRRRAVHRLDAIGGDRYGDRLDGPNCRAAEKSRRLTSGWRTSAGSTQKCGRTATAPATASCWPADHAVWVNGATISEAPEVVAG